MDSFLCSFWELVGVNNVSKIWTPNLIDFGVVLELEKGAEIIKKHSENDAEKQARENVRKSAKKGSGGTKRQRKLCAGGYVSGLAEPGGA